MKRKMIIPTIALVAILGAVAVGTVTVSAQTPMYGNLVSQIAQRFNLKESDVQDVVNQIRSTQMAQAKTNWENKLTQAVTDGKITDAQKQLIIAKSDEVKTQMAALKGLSVADKRAKMKQIFTDLEGWAKTNNINLKQIGLFGVRPGFGMGFHAGFRAGKNS